MLVGRLPKGCRLCISGAKLVLFVTGLCKRGCFYCPLSDKRKNKDIAYANERPVKSPNDVIEEAVSMSALGTGVTGGDPSMRFERTIRYIKILKSKFRKGHHIHMYCCGPLSGESLARLKNAGLDEIRFHTWSIAPVKAALEAGLIAGVELPVEPRSHANFIEFFRKLDEIGCKFANLNELEFSDTNFEEFKARGYVARPNSMAVEGSEKTALKILKWGAKNVRFDIHYCPSSLKDAVQLRNRLERKARNLARPHEEITDEGLLFKGVVLGVPVGKTSGVRSSLLKKYRITPDLVFINRKKKRVELHWSIAKKLAKLEPSLKFALVEEYPTFDALETTVIPL